MYYLSTQHTIICDDNSLNDGEKYQQLPEAFHAGNERLDTPAPTDEQSAHPDCIVRINNVEVIYGINNVEVICN